MDDYFNDMEFPDPVYPNATASGFVYVNLDERMKIVEVDLFSPGEVKSFTFIVRVPGFKADIDLVDLDALYPEEDIVHIDDLEDFRRELERLPCCTTNEDGGKNGDPLNLVFIGTREDIGGAFVRRGWHPTERIHSGSMWRTVSAFLTGSRYRYSPVSSLYVYGRQQDIAIQRIRSSIHMRNHLRLWLSPMRFQGKPVWVGQISRDIGVIFTPKSWTLTTHKIDPDVDEARNGLIGDLAYSQGLEKFGFVKGVGQAPRSEPRRNLMDDTYYTDGFRVVFWFEPKPRSLADVKFVDWARPRGVELLETK
ncbi:MAG: LssY C-terminal domain-containing protein [Deltaproteobacteria bacterium]|nr:LssY C-terminal domain-containing protein [Deltaproteobacteria bacterium]